MPKSNGLQIWSIEKEGWRMKGKSEQEPQDNGQSNDKDEDDMKKENELEDEKSWSDII